VAAELRSQIPVPGKVLASWPDSPYGQQDLGVLAARPSASSTAGAYPRPDTRLTRQWLPWDPGPCPRQQRPCSRIRIQQDGGVLADGRAVLLVAVASLRLDLQPTRRGALLWSDPWPRLRSSVTMARHTADKTTASYFLPRSPTRKELSKPQKR
jgi:hypothetical protein